MLNFQGVRIWCFWGVNSEFLPITETHHNKQCWDRSVEARLDQYGLEQPTCAVRGFLDGCVVTWQHWLQPGMCITSERHLLIMIIFRFVSSDICMEVVVEKMTPEMPTCCSCSCSIGQFYFDAKPFVLVGLCPWSAWFLLCCQECCFNQSWLWWHDPSILKL